MLILAGQLEALSGGLMGETARVAAVALALLEGVAHTARGGSSTGGAARLVREAARVTAIALAALEGVARTGRTGAAGRAKCREVTSTVSTCIVEELDKIKY